MLRDHIGCEGSNLGWSHAREVPTHCAIALAQVGFAFEDDMMMMRTVTVPVLPSMDREKAVLDVGHKVSMGH